MLDLKKILIYELDKYFLTLQIKNLNLLNWILNLNSYRILLLITADLTSITIFQNIF